MGLAFLPPAQVMEGFDIITNKEYTTDKQECHMFNTYFWETWLIGSYPLQMWNHFRSDVPRTNNNCEGYNIRLGKRDMRPHLNIYHLIHVIKDEESNKKAYMMQVETHHHIAKQRRKVQETDQKLHKYGLEYMLCERGMASYLSACGGSVAGFFE